MTEDIRRGSRKAGRRGIGVKEGLEAGMLGSYQAGKLITVVNLQACMPSSLPAETMATF